MKYVHRHRVYWVSIFLGFLAFTAWLFSPSDIIRTSALAKDERSVANDTSPVREQIPNKDVLDPDEIREGGGEIDGQGTHDQSDVVHDEILPEPVPAEDAVEDAPIPSRPDAEPPVKSGSFFYPFSTDGELKSASTMAESSSPYFWVSSGGRLVIKDGRGSTMRGVASETDPARAQYARVNPLDTDGGAHPQNTFRLVTRQAWGAGEMSARFRVLAHNETATPNRDGYSGLFLMSRYRNQHNLYYAGLRSDGKAVIKKKINGTYHTLAIARVFGDERSYGASKKSLIPTNTWIQIMSRVTDVDKGVLIELFVDLGSGELVRVLAAEDAGVGGAVFAEGHGGIRTDYMDAEFDDFSFKSL